MTGREHWSEVGYWLSNCHPGGQRTSARLWCGNPEGEVPVEWASAACVQTKDRCRVNKVPFLLVAAAWNLASCGPDTFDSTDIYGLWLSYALFFIERKKSNAPFCFFFFFEVFLYVCSFLKSLSTPVFLPGESQGRGSLVGCVYGVA